MTRASRRVALSTAGVVALTAALGGQATRSLSLESIYDPARRVDFNGSPSPDITWLDAGTYLMERRAGRGSEWMKVDSSSGKASTFIDAGQLERAIASLPGVSREEARLLSSGELRLNPAKTGTLLTISDDLDFYDLATSRITRLTNTPGEEEEAQFSPDGRRVAFVRLYNLVVVDVPSQREQTLTTDGHRQMLNGKLDWLYQEEIYGRGRFRAFWWSPDSSRIAFLQLDERPVPEYTVVDHLPYRPSLEVTDYPKAGDPNPLVKLGIAQAGGGQLQWVDLEPYMKGEFLIVNVDWTPDSRFVVHQVQDREQTWLDLNLADASNGQQPDAAP